MCDKVKGLVCQPHGCETWTSADGSRVRAGGRSGGLKRRTTVGWSEQWATARCAVRAATMVILPEICLYTDLVLRHRQCASPVEGKSTRAAKEKAAVGTDSVDSAAALANVTTDSFSVRSGSRPLRCHPRIWTRKSSS